MNSKVFIYCIGSVILGLIMSIKPEYILNASVIIASIFAVYNGLYYLIKKTTLIPGDNVYKWTVIARSFISIIMGVCGFYLPFIGKLSWSNALLMMAIFYIVYAAVQLFLIIQITHSYPDYSQPNQGIKMKPYWIETVISILIFVVFLILSKYYDSVSSFMNIAGIIFATAGATIIVIGIFTFFKEEEHGHIVEVVDDISNEIKKSDE